MKKFMILLLSLAVLFSFAACDNSSNTPADEPSTGVSDYVVSDLAKSIPSDINDALDGTTGVFVSSKLTVTDGALASGYTLSSDYKTLSYTETKAAEGQKPDAKSVLSGNHGRIGPRVGLGAFQHKRVPV